jgi:hypothetical protein
MERDEAKIIASINELTDAQVLKLDRARQKFDQATTLQDVTVTSLGLLYELFASPVPCDKARKVFADRLAAIAAKGAAPKS